MELRQYWGVIWRRRWIVLAIIVLATLLSLFLALTAHKSYTNYVRFITRQEPTDPTGQTVDNITTPFTFTFDRYYNWFGSEFLVDDYTQIVGSDAFARSVIDVLTNDGTIAQQVTTDTTRLQKLNDDIGKLKLTDVRDGLGADRAQRELRVQITSGSRDLTAAITNAVATVLTQGKLKPVQGNMVNDRAVFTQLDVVDLNKIQSSSSKEIVNAITRVIIGLVAALAIAFLLEYLDRSVRDERDAARVLELPVLGTIPRT